MPLSVKDAVPIIVPPSIQRRAGIKPGEKLKFKAGGGVITITAKRDPDKDEYTPEQRRKIMRGVRKGLAEIEAGQISGPYNSVAEMAADIEAGIRRRRTEKRTRRK